jgi:isohexenylglutaconyl-CoA hydratase
LTAERFNGEKALEYGIAHYACDADEIDTCLDGVITQVLQCGPRANAVTKQIMLAVGTMPDEDLIRHSAQLFAELNRSPEGREGQAAFAEKRNPSWQVA